MGQISQKASGAMSAGFMGACERGGLPLRVYLFTRDQVDALNAAIAALAKVEAAHEALSKTKEEKP